jgi:uncharacterized cupredoxin-like copper-binding protein
MHRLAILALAPAAALVAVGCGSSSSSKKSTSSAAAPPATTAAPSAVAGGNAITVGLSEFKLTPSNPSAKAGKVTITARNTGSVPHAIEVEGGGAGGGDAKSPTISPGNTATLTVALKPGKTYEWYCPIDNHKNMGMKGTIKVTGSAASASSSTKTATSSNAGGTSGGASGGSGGGY